MGKRQTRGKLSLNKETVKMLTGGVLANVVGGEFDSCGDPASTCPISGKCETLRFCETLRDCGGSCGHEASTCPMSGEGCIFD